MPLPAGPSRAGHRRISLAAIRHDGGSKTVLGVSGNLDGDAVLNILLAQPQTAEFVVRKQWREFVSLTPDEVEVRRIARRFRDSGYDTRVAADGAMALQQLDGVDLLVTDVVMPVMGGIELATTARRDRPELPVLLMSGYGDQPAVLRQLQEPSTDFLQKPFNADALEAAVRQILDQRERRPTGPTGS